MRILFRLGILTVLAALCGVLVWIILHQAQAKNLLISTLHPTFQNAPVHIYAPPIPIHSSAPIALSAPTRLTLAEIRFDVLMAQQLLFLGREPTTALQLLQQADQLSSTYPQSAWLQLRSALATDMMHIQSLQSQDRVGTYLQINALRQNIAQADMVLIPNSADALIKTPQSPPSRNVQAPSHSWHEVVEAGLHEFHQLIQIRRVPANAILLPNKTLFAALKAHLTALLDEAAWAWLHGQPDIYHQALATTVSTLQSTATWFTPATTAQLEQRLQSLNQQQLPSENKQTLLDNTLNALQKLESQKLESSGAQP